MAVQGYKTRILLGSMNLSCVVRSASVNYPTEVADVTTLCDGPNKAYITGVDSGGSFSADGPLDVASSTNQPFDVLGGWQQAGALPITYIPDGLTAGNGAWVMTGVNTDFTSTGGAGSSSADFSVGAQIAGSTEMGYMVTGLDTLTGTTSSAAVDDGAATTNGGIATLHVTTYATLTSDTVTIEGSANGTTGWAVLTGGTFAAVTAVGSQQITVTGSVPRYLRAVDTIVGSGSITRAVAFARR